MAAARSPDLPSGTNFPQSRLRRALRRVGAAVGLLLVFTGAAAVGVALHLNAPPARRLAANALHSLLHASLAGDAQLRGLDHLGLYRIAFREAVVVDPRGDQALLVQGVEARFNALEIAREALFGKGDLAISIASLSVEHADVVAEQGPSTAPTLAEAFQPRAFGPPEPTDPRGRPLRITLERLRLGSAWIHGEIAAAQPIDAEVRDLRGAFELSPEGVSLVLEPTSVLERRVLAEPIAGTLQARLRTHADTTAVEGRFQGQVGASDVMLQASMDGDRVVVDAEIPRLTPEALSRLLPDPPLTRPIRVQAHADGTLPVLGVEARIAEVDAPSRAITLKSSIDLEGPVRMQVDVAVLGVDPQLFAPKAPSAAIDANARAQITLGDGLPRVVADLHTEPTRIGDQLVPAVDAHVDFEGGVLHGTVTVREEGAPIEGAFALTEGPRARFELTGAVAAIHSAPRLESLIGGNVDGSARLRIHGSFADGNLDARFQSSFSILPGKTPVALRRGEISGRVHGPPEALTVDASLRGEGLAASDRSFEHVSARVVGPVTMPRVSASLAGGDRFLSASAQIDPTAQGARQIRASLRHGDASASVAIDRLQSQPGGARFEGIELQGEGVGGVTGSIAIGARGITGALRGEAVDLGRLADLAGLPLSIGGVVNFDVALHRAKRGSLASTSNRGAGIEGRVAFDLEDGAYEDIRGISAHLTTTLDGDDLKAEGMVRLLAVTPTGGRREEDEPCRGPVATLRLENAKATLRGPLLDARTWKDLRGEGQLIAEDVDLRCLAQRSPTPLPDAISELAGKVTARLSVSQAEAARFPSVHDLSIKTRGLTVKGPKDPKTGAPTWASTALDLAISGDFDGDSGLTRGEITVLDHRALLYLSAAATLDLPALLGDPARRARALRKTPVATHLSIPRRALKDFNTLPSIAREQLPAMSGEVALDVYAAGTLDAPRVAVRARGFSIEQDASRLDRQNRASKWAFPIDLDAAAFYDSHKGRLDAHVSHAGRELASARAEVKTELDALLARKPDQSVAWTGSVHATLSDLPLAQLPYLADHDIQGSLRGSVAIDGLNEKPTIAVDLSALDLQMSPDLFFDQANLLLHVGPDGSAGDQAKLEAHFVAQDGGRLDASADLGIRWKAGAVPLLDPQRSARAELRARRFRLAAAQPFLADAVSRLDGYLDGRLALSWAHIGQAKDNRIEGALHVTQGIVEIPKLGQELRDAELTLIADPDGTLRIEKIAAQGTSGSFHGSGLVRYEGGSLKSAHAELIIPKGQDLPITLEGVPLGEARGRVSVDAKSRGEELDIAVKVPDFHLALPSSIGKSAQPLDPNKDIVIVPPIAPPEEDEKAPPKSGGDGTRMAIGIKLGDIQIEGKGIDVTLTENEKASLRITIADQTAVAGGIKILRGKVEVLGKVFEIEPGSLISLRPEEPSNPFLNVTASWSAPDGTRVFIDYIGGLSPITREKIKFRSDPPKSQQEVISLLLFGPEYEQGTIAGGPDTGQPKKSATETATGAAASVGSSFASDQITQVLQGIAPLQGISVKLSTTDEGALQTSLGYKIGRNITATATFGGEGGSTSHSAGGTANQTGSASTAVGIEWRFRPQWSLRASVGMGDATSTGLDLLWTKRY
jgi:translocation and assembly module TamB